MINFRDKNLHQHHKAEFRKFLNNKLITPEQKEEMENQLMIDSGENAGLTMDMGSYLGGDGIDLGGLDDGSDGGFGGFDDLFGGDSDTKQRNSDIKNERIHETGSWWKDIVYAPFFLVFYVIKLLAYDFPTTKEEYIGILKALNKITMFTAIFSMILWFLDFKFIFSLQFQAITSACMFICSYAILELWLEKDKKSDSSEGFDFGMDNSFEFGDDDPAYGYGVADVDDLGKFMLNTNDDFGDDLEGVYEESDTPKANLLPPSPIDISSDEAFSMSILEVFNQSKKYMGVEINDRRKLLDSFSPYIVTNDKEFGSWKNIPEGGIEYNNIAFTLFRGLCQIQNQFNKDEERMVVLAMKSSPLLFRIEVELPKYFKKAQIVKGIKDLETFLMKDGNDTEKAIIVDYFNGKFVFKFLRLDNKNLISLGDILRFYDEETGKSPIDDFANPKKGLPMLLGLRNNEYPYFVDLEANTSGVIVGGSGSGKSWLTFLVMFNFVLANDYNNVNFVIFDLKNASFWNQFAKFPHVLGYHTDSTTYLEKFRELYKEVNRRKDLLVELEAENFKGLREKYRMKGEYEKLKEVPLLTIVVDEITSTMQDMKTYYEQNDDKASYDEVRAIMSKITQEGRSLGVRLICIGQRSIDNSVPKNVMANSSFKFAMKMDAESDFGIMMGKEVEPLPKPESAGLGLARTFEESGIHNIKTLTVGGNSDAQILTLIRVLALEWTRRSLGVDNIINPPPTMNLDICYNRDKFIQENLRELQEGRILSKNTVIESSKLDLSDVGGDVKLPKSVSLSKKGSKDKSHEGVNWEETDNKVELEKKPARKSPQLAKKKDNGLSDEDIEFAKRQDALLRKREKEMKAKKMEEQRRPTTEAVPVGVEFDDFDSIYKSNEYEEPIAEVKTVPFNSGFLNVDIDDDIDDDDEIDIVYNTRKTEQKANDIFIDSEDENPTVKRRTQRTDSVRHVEEEQPTIKRRTQRTDSVRPVEEEQPTVRRRPQRTESVRPVEEEQPTIRRRPQRTESVRPVEVEQPTVRRRPQRTESLDKNNNLPIKDFIAEYGEKDGFFNYKILKEDLEPYYHKTKIQKELNNITLIEDGDWYITNI